MIGNRITYRMADGVRVPGTWRHAFIRNFDYHLTDLFIYADGLIDCWGLVTLEEFEEKLCSGWVATELPEGAEASAFDLARWKFAEPRTWLTPEILVAEIRDTIDQLNGRPDSRDRCALSVADPALREAVAAADSTFSARDLAADAERSEGWERSRTAVMARLLRAKFTRHPELARALLATDDATIVYGDSDSAFWGDDRGRGRNWTGRLLELVRSELACPIPSRPS